MGEDRERKIVKREEQEQELSDTGLASFARKNGERNREKREINIFLLDFNRLKG